MKKNFEWTCQNTWKRSAYNTLWCLIRCSIGDFGIIVFFQLLNILWTTLYIMFLVLIICNMALAQSSLPECEGSDIKDPIKNYLKLKKWTNCIGIGRGLNGETYVGEFYKGKFHGQGTATTPNRKYVGQWKDGKKHGYGTYKFINGDQYVGEWKKGLRHGRGTFTYSNGKIENGIWKKDKLIKLK